MEESAESDFITLTRSKVAFYLDDFETPLGRAISLFLTGLILLSCSLFVIQTYPLPPTLRTILEDLDQAILLGFALEYILRFWGSQHKVKFVFSPYSLIDLVAILPFFLGFLNLSFLRIFRWFRILRLIRFIEVEVYIFKIRTEDSIILARIIFTLLTIIFVFSGLIYQVENPVNPEIFGTFLDAIYFAVVTMTTVGFGDVVPLSETGRFLTILMILTGIALIPWQVGDLIKQLVKTARYLETVCSGCGCSSHDLDALYCKRCGAQLKVDSDS